MNTLIGPTAIVLLVAQFAALGLVMWRVSRWRQWLLLKRVILWILVGAFAMMIWNLFAVLTTPVPR